MTENLAARLKMTHLEDPPSTEALKSSVETNVLSPSGKEKDVSANDPKDNEEWPFEFDWTDARGKRWQGSFVNKILTIGEQQLVAVLKARLNGNVPIEAVDPTMSVINSAIAHMTYSLKKTPDWAKDLRQLRDVSLVLALWEKVSAHETQFFRLDANPQAGP